MEESRERRWRIRLAIGTLVLSVVGFLLGVWQYRAEGEREREAAARQSVYAFNRELWLDQYATYRHISVAVGKLISALEQGDQDAMRAAEGDFLALYWGRGTYVEDREVERAMIAFRELLQQHKQQLRTDDQLRNKAVELNRILKRSARVGSRAAPLGIPLALGER